MVIAWEDRDEFNIPNPDNAISPDVKLEMREHYEYDFPFRFVEGCWIASQFKRFRSNRFPISFYLTFTLQRAGIELS